MTSDKPEPMPAPYQPLFRHSCHRCGETFPMFDQLQEHRANEHGEEEAA